MVNRTPLEMGSTTLKAKMCVSDAIKLWNIAPNDIKSCTSLNGLKKKVKEFVKTLPIWNQSNDNHIKNIHYLYMLTKFKLNCKINHFSFITAVSLRDRK